MINHPFIRYWLPLLAHMSVIYYLSSSTSFPVAAPDWMFFADKIVHVGIFGLLGLLFLRAWLNGKWKHLSAASGLAAVVFVGVYGLSDEVHQMFVPGRHPSVYDLIADVCGGIMAVIAVMIYNQFTTTDEHQTD